VRRLALALVLGGPCVALWLAGPVVLGHILFSLGYTAAAADLMHDPAWKGYALARAKQWEAAAGAFGVSPANAYNRANALAWSHHYHDAIDVYDDALDANPEDEDARFNKDIVQKIIAGGGVDAGTTTSMANASANKEHKGKASDIGDGDTSSMGNGYVGNQEGSSQSGSQGSSKVSRVGKGQKQTTESGSGKATGSASQGSGAGRSGGDLADVTAMLAENQRKVVRGHTDQSVVPSVEWLQTLPDDPGRFLKLRILAEQKRRAAHASGPEEDDD
jgi:Ca-activated chloride channel family protein